MELRANCKINLGLRVLKRRADGFHDIETVMMPVRGLFDTLSVEPLPTGFVPATPPPFGPPRGAFSVPGRLDFGVQELNSVLEISGSEVDCEPEKNICMRALRLMQTELGIGEAWLRLHKNIPVGAGLGGGSADAAAVLLAVNQQFALDLQTCELETFAARLGSDVPFFIRNTPMLCTGRGEIMTPMEVELEDLLAGKWLVILKPATSVSTAEAYDGITPSAGGISVAEAITRPIDEWRGVLENQFETTVFEHYPEIAALKTELYSAGAVYASMSGSGSAVYGIFEAKPRQKFRDLVFRGKM